jgi:hypothetical protein
MSYVTPIARSHPRPPANIAEITRAADACFACVQSCIACSDACLSEKDVERMVACIRLNLDCADVCHATGSLLVRLGRDQPQPLQAQLAACAQACRSCAEECLRHADMHEHCQVCAQVCADCEEACEEVMRVMRHAGESHASHRP